MKTKFILGSMIMSVAFAACSNEELATIESAGNQSELIELSENFMIGVVGEENLESRTHWDFNVGKTALVNYYAPVFTESTGNNTLGIANVVAPTIGLCWIGQTLGDNVYTNYEFIHNGWLGKNQAAAAFDVCDDSELLNGWLYSELTTATATEGEEVVIDVPSDGSLNKTYSSTTLKLSEMNYNSGVYKTENKAIFGGQYIAYYPYNPDFKDAGTIPAKSAVEFNVAKNDIKDMSVSDNTFRYTNVATIAGGAKAQGFGFNNLSGIVRIQLESKSTGAALTRTVEKVLLYSASAGFLKEVRLSASAIAQGKTGADLYTEVVERSKTVLVNLTSAITPCKKNAGLDEACVYISALPTTISDLKVLAYDADEEKWAECSVGNFTVAAGAGKKITANFADTDFKKKYYAVDQATLETALSEAKTAGESNNYAVVEVLGDIELTDGAFIDGYVTVQGDKLIVTEGKVLNIANGAKLKSDVIVKGQSCCGGSADAGVFMTSANAVTIEGNVTLEEGYTGKKNARMVLAAPTTFASTSTITANGNIEVGQTFDIFGSTITSENVVDIKGKLVNNKTMTVVSELNTKGAEIINNGTIEVFGNYAVLDAQGSTVASAGKKMTNNGTFIDNVGATVGGATQYMINNGDYICKVADQSRLNEAYTNKLASNVIEFVNEDNTDFHFDAVKKHNNKDVDIVLNATGATGFKPNKVTTLGNLTIKSPLYIHKSAEIKNDYGKVIGYATIDVNGNIDVKSTLVVRTDVRNLTAKNFTVYANGGNARFENRSADNLSKTMAVSGTIEVKNGTTKGKFTINAAESGKNIALITCTKLIEGGTFSGKPEVIE